ncbi:hypothetical protein AN189_07385 [Loktanella sp. 3ANDIMAR09]|uniref:hypothetical protein n=1 Tax=Loktanella sp. 3ANDIMAR09 TaxID=1225657 RepID=UPI0006F6C234|nr:hypothetical protein [Loktanella sp. 3ANDIMAR09]KQI68714.1 hypothetical protein AN189_07385 [Loktanella sp. 3ANDIMAR09]
MGQGFQHVAASRRVYSQRVAFDLSILVSDLCIFYGTGPAALSSILLNDTRFFQTARYSVISGTPFKFSSHRMDRALGLISQIWPSELPWPAEVPRCEPLPFDDDVQSTEIRAWLKKRRAAKLEKDSKDGENTQD